MAFRFFGLIVGQKRRGGRSLQTNVLQKATSNTVSNSKGRFHFQETARFPEGQTCRDPQAWIGMGIKIGSCLSICSTLARLSNNETKTCYQLALATPVTRMDCRAKNAVSFLRRLDRKTFHQREFAKGVGDERRYESRKFRR